MPFELIKPGDEGVGEDEVVVDERAIGAASAVGDAPAKGLAGAGENLVAAMSVLEVDRIGVAMVTEAAGLNDGEEAPADLGFFRPGELDGDDAGGIGAVEHAPETLADAGGINDDVLGMPGVVEILELAQDGGVVLAEPTEAGNHMIGGMPEVRQGGEVDGDDSEGGGVTAGVGQAGGGTERIDDGFVLAGNVEEESMTLRIEDFRSRIGQPHPHPSLRCATGGYAIPILLKMGRGDH
jgi:hypothetical protein